MMKRHMSICYSNKDSVARKIDLHECMECISNPLYAVEDKNESALIFQCYSSTLDIYPRLETKMDSFSSLFIDCDNEESDPLVIEKWNERMKDYEHYTYETASSTPERPKFRGIVPLDCVLSWNRHMKEAVFNVFKDFADPRASWFYAPTLGKIDTFKHHEGIPFPASRILDEAREIERLERVENDRRQMSAMRWRLSHPNELNSQDAWRHLPSVKKCLEGLCEGERDNSLRNACYAMEKNGYGESIRQFLEECHVPEYFKKKWQKRSS